MFVDRIGLLPASATTVPAHAPRINLSGLGTADAPLLDQARAAGAALAAALGRANEPVAVARLEDAALGFAREVKALQIGGLGRSPEAVDSALSAAIAVGEQTAASLPDVGLDDSDRITVLLQAAAQALADTPTPPLHDPSVA